MTWIANLYMECDVCEEEFSEDLPVGDSPENVAEKEGWLLEESPGRGRVLCPDCAEAAP